MRAWYYNTIMRMDNYYLCPCGCTGFWTLTYYAIRFKLTGRNPPWAGRDDY